MAGKELVIEIATLPGGVVIQPIGEVDMARSPTLRAKLIEAARSRPQPERLIVDLTQVPHMDSSGVATLVEALQKASRGGPRLVLCGMVPRVRSIFEISRLLSVFSVTATRAEAQEA